GVSILPSTARPTADWLATRGRPLHGQLDRVGTHRGVTGAALLDESLSTLECETTDAYAGGDHTIVVGRVLSVEISDRPGDALMYYRGRYDSLA
ncbi:MAG: flavin reductase family protein, partial [Lapillicoccus sp.]